MSFIDLATLTMHRRHELESRIHIFEEKCNRAIGDIQKMKTKASSFISELNCDPSELKERFLHLMKKLDEYTYLITDFNLAMAQTADASGMDSMPVQDNPAPGLLAVMTPYNLMDALTEPTPTTTRACPNNCPPQKPLRIKIPKEEQKLIIFSSSSSAESVPRKSEMVAKEVQCKLTEEMASLAVEVALVQPSPLPAPDNSEDSCNLPAQSVLEVEATYQGTIMALDGAFFYVITDDVQEVTDFMREMTDFYKENVKKLTPKEAASLTCCAYYDEESDCFYRALLVKELKEENKVVVFVVDTGEINVVSLEAVQPLVPQYCARAPYARCCYLAGVDLDIYNDKEIMRKHEAFMERFVGKQCTIQVDDNTSEYLGVYVILPSEQCVNDILIERGLAVPIDKPVKAEKKSPEVVHGPPEDGSLEHLNNIDITTCPEYDNPVEAVTGYDNRDEADICKNYKGPPEKTCFKGSRCTKKHIVKHPDGWTVDRVNVVGKCRSLPPPAPGTWHKLLVTSVCHFDKLYAQIVNENKQKETAREFGMVLPPMTLESLVREMNSPATIQAYKTLTMSPAPGELVAAVYPLDDCWYRARVLSVTRADQSMEVMYIDYGTMLWVKEDQIRALEPRLTVLPAQAILCTLAGVRAKVHDSQQWAQAKNALTELVHNRIVDAHIIAREYDEVIVELYDDAQCSVTKQLAARGFVNLQKYEVDLDENVTHKVVVP